MTTPPPHDPNAHIANMEDTERRFHVPAMPLEVLGTSDNVTGTWKRFSASSTSVKILYMIPLHYATDPINHEAQEVPILVKVHAAQPPTPNKPPHEHTWCHGVVWNR